ncbi:MAG TPA: hypothetical protein VGV60_03335 [Candidatus Polarisedimenticolia bacterium]|nr:hypothetical protein [Candidatus Polarisedimenticolia bacterium]
MTRDEEHLRLLSIFHYVVAGLSCMLAIVPLIYIGMGALMLRGGNDGAGEKADARVIGWAIIAAGSLLVAVVLTFALGLVLAGRSLSSRRHHTFCLVMAAVACIFMPFGTVLGVLTIIVLQREPVRRLFGLEPSLPRG